MALATPTPDNLRSIQILRAIAATSVVYYHLGAVPQHGSLVVFGSFGVDIFFVISGFVMAMVCGHGETPRAFAAKRVARIVPLYWVLTTGVLLLAAVRPDLLNSTTAHLGNYVKSLLFIPYFKENGALHPMLALGWTLNYEMFFYLCVGLVLLAGRRNLALFIGSVAALVTAAYIVLGHLAGGPVLSSFFGSALLFEFLFGMVAYLLWRQGRLSGASAPWLIAAALAAYAFMAACESRGATIDRVFVFGLPSFVLVLAFVGCERWIPGPGDRVCDALCRIGDASYATYLSHFYVVEGIRKIAHQKFGLIDPYRPVGVAVILVSALVVGHVVYLWLDRPLSRWARRVLLPARKLPQALPAD